MGRVEELIVEIEGQTADKGRAILATAILLSGCSPSVGLRYDMANIQVWPLCFKDIYDVQSLLQLPGVYAHEKAVLRHHKMAKLES